jgi:glycosyltransferase involved in cell wall biosynthesis
VSPPVVVFVDHVAELSGGERSLLEVVTHLDGCRPVVLLAADGPLAAALRDGGIEVEVVPLDPDTAGARRDRGLRSAAPAGRLMGWGRRLGRRLDELGASVVVANSMKAGVALTLARPSIRFVWAVRDRIRPDYLGRGALLVARAALAVGPDVVVANSRTTAATCPRRRPVVVIPPSVTPPRCRPGTPDEPFRAAVVGRLAPWKGQDHALAAFADAFPGGPETLVFVGGPLFGEEAFAAELRARATTLGGRVTFTGHVADVAGALDGVHALVHASRLPEPFGRSVVEGMGAGLAVVAMAAGGPAEVVTDGVDGLLVGPDDRPALTAALRRLAADPDLRAALGAAGRRTAAAYAPDRLADRWRATLGLAVGSIDVGGGP